MVALGVDSFAEEMTLIELAGQGEMTDHGFFEAVRTVERLTVSGSRLLGLGFLQNLEQAHDEGPVGEDVMTVVKVTDNADLVDIEALRGLSVRGNGFMYGNAMLDQSEAEAVVESMDIEGSANAYANGIGVTCGEAG